MFSGSCQRLAEGSFSTRCDNVIRHRLLEDHVCRRDAFRKEDAIVSSCLNQRLVFLSTSDSVGAPASPSLTLCKLDVATQRLT
jgi:hypothetical protein